MLPGLFVLAGIGAGLLAGGRLELRLDPATLAVFLPGLIFDGAWQIAPVRLSRVALPVGFLAVPGVAVGAAATAAVIVASGLLGWPAAAALGAILAATDPVAVLAVFRRLPVAPTLRTLVEAESIANDAVAVALLQTALVVGTIAATGEPVVLRAAVAFAFSLGIGIA
ncbi:MAG: cation:proton antiporter, partial [Vulcanimicrobiaceae bacterium]